MRNKEILVYLARKSQPARDVEDDHGGVEERERQVRDVTKA